VKKCRYCDFYSQTDLGQIPAYLAALKKEIKIRGSSKKEINTIYFGGGTPSLLSPGEIAGLLQTVQDHFSISERAEITLEINPGTIDAAYFQELKQTGVNRLSIGIQSFEDEKLKFLGRIHTAEKGYIAVSQAAAAGFENISLDLIYGLPDETPASWQRDLLEAVYTSPCHLSCYMLTVEPGTPLFHASEKGLFFPLGNEAMSGLFKQTVKVLGNAGYEQYEISSFSKDRKYRSRHNSSYWDMTAYSGFGSAAHTYDGRERSWNCRSIRQYMEDLSQGRLPVEDRELLSQDQKLLEMILLRLRTLEGIDLDQFEALFHISFEKKFEKILKRLTDSAFGRVKDHWFFLTFEGKTHLNGIVEAFASEIL
jgi:oxygen-independent coproporphyrinogen-3 oxidase